MSAAKNEGKQSIFSNQIFCKCESAIGYKFQKLDLLRKALTHSSTRSGENCNERLEFLGDAILGMIISDYLYTTFHDFNEGDLSLIKSEVVSRAALARAANKMKLQNFFAFCGSIGKNAELPNSVLANVFEAIVGAIYLDSGVAAAQTFILKSLRFEIESAIKYPYQKNYKSLLQFISQKYLAATPSYKVLHPGKKNAKEFFSYAIIGDRTFFAAKGKNKKESEQLAADAALQVLALEDPIIAEALQGLLHPHDRIGHKERLVNMLNIFHNSKTLLNYITCKFSLPKPCYYKVKKKKIFFVEVGLGGRSFGQMHAEKCKEAERLAARTALEVLAEEHSNRSSQFILPYIDYQCFIDVSANGWPQWSCL